MNVTLCNICDYRIDLNSICVKAESLKLGGIQEGLRWKPVHLCAVCVAEIGRRVAHKIRPEAIKEPKP